MVITYLCLERACLLYIAVPLLIPSSSEWLVSQGILSVSSRCGGMRAFDASWMRRGCVRGKHNRQQKGRSYSGRLHNNSNLGVQNDYSRREQEGRCTPQAVRRLTKKSPCRRRPNVVSTLLQRSVVVESRQSAPYQIRAGLYARMRPQISTFFRGVATNSTPFTHVFAS